MTFTTLTFLIFLALVWPAYWAMKSRTHQNLLILVSSVYFYAYWDARFAVLMLATATVDFVVALQIAASTSPQRRKLLLWVSLASNLGVLGFFKYCNFFVDSAATMLRGMGFHVSPFYLDILLPVGISFYTFQALSYTIDVYRGHLPATRSLVEYLAYITFFPQLVAGPIERAVHLLPQFQRDRRFDPAIAVDGCRQILWGFFIKMVVADNLATLVDSTYDHAAAFDGKHLLVATFFFSIQIYADFSGYSHIALGLAKLFGFDLMNNFALPYFSQSVPEFWRRWHISLSTWFRDYLYIPLGGSRASSWKRARNILITFVISGLWHGAAWNYVIWGALNGLAMVPSVVRNAQPGGARPGRSALPAFPTLRMAGTFVFILFTWVFFRAPDLATAGMILQRIGLSLSGLDTPGRDFSGQVGTKVAFALAGLMLALEWSQRARAHAFQALGQLPQSVRWSIYVCIGWLIVGAGAVSTGRFIYFQF